MDNLQNLKQRIGGTDWEPLVGWITAAFVFIIAQPLISLLHEMTVLLATSILNLVVSLPPFQLLVRSLIADEVYALVALEMINNTHALGVAVSGAIGELLHGLWPTLFVDPGLVVQGASASAVLTSGSSVVSQFLVVAAADGLLVFVGLLLVRLGLRGKPLLRAVLRPAKINGIALFGLLLQVRGVVAIVSTEISLANLESAGLAQVGTKLLLTSRESYETQVVPIGPWLSLGIQVLMLAVIYAAAVLLTRLLLYLAKAARRRSTPAGSVGPPTSTRMSRAWHLIPVAMVAILASVLPTFGMAATNFSYDNSNLSAPDSYVTSDTRAADSGLAESYDRQASDKVSRTESPTRPSVVSVSGDSYNYVYEVGGKKEVIRGMGYNVIYRDLSTEERAERYEKDFARMRDAGINTLLGWDSDKGYEHDKFDEVLLAKAQEYGLGVIMPYYLPPDGDYEDEEYRARLQADVVAWVLRFRGNPAVRMWAIGNEVLHGMPPSRDAKAFAEFYLNLAETVHAVDSNHPIIYREAEDVFLAPLKEVWTRDDVKRPWLVYGMNIFTFRISRVLADWHNQDFDVPVVVTEFGPNGLAAEHRARGLVKMWRTMRNYPCDVLGGVVYAWTTAGPEPIDRVFGLVDENSIPVDGALDAIGEEFRQGIEPARDCSTFPVGPPLADR